MISAIDWIWCASHQVQRCIISYWVFFFILQRVLLENKRWTKFCILWESNQWMEVKVKNYVLCRQQWDYRCRKNFENKRVKWVNIIVRIIAGRKPRIEHIPSIKYMYICALQNNPGFNAREGNGLRSVPASLYKEVIKLSGLNFLGKVLTSTWKIYNLNHSNR